MASPLPRIVSVELLPFSSIIPSSKDLILSIQPSISWIDPIIAYLQNRTLPENRKESEWIRHKSLGYWVSKEGKLYKRSYLGPYLLCVHPEAVEVLLEELYEGICGSLIGGRSLPYRALTQGNWWSNIQNQAMEFSKKYDQCQRFTSSIHQSGGLLNLISSPWPFAQ